MDCLASSSADLSATSLLLASWYDFQQFQKYLEIFQQDSLLHFLLWVYVQLHHINHKRYSFKEVGGEDRDFLTWFYELSPAVGQVRSVLALAVDPLTENIFYILDVDR